jgi:hypothetical protein
MRRASPAGPPLEALAGLHQIKLLNLLINVKSYYCKKRLILPLALLAAGLGGCVSFQEDKTTPEEKDTIASKSEKIATGQSSDFVLGLMGPPKEKIPEDGGRELWKWTYVKATTDFTGIPFLYLSGKETKVDKHSFVEFKDGVVTKAWVE